MKNQFLLVFLFFVITISSCDKTCTKTFEGDEENRILSRVDFFYDCSDTTNFLHKAFYPNGQLAHSVEIISGKRNGWYFELDQNGDTLRKGNYKNGLREGLWIITATDTYLEKTYSEDTLEGRTREKHKNGTTINGQYSANKETGKWIWNLPDSTKETRNYIDGELNGSLVSYYANGNKKWQAHYSNDSTYSDRIFFDSAGVVVTKDEWFEK